MNLLLWYIVIIMTVCQVSCGGQNIQQGQKFDDRSVKNIQTGKTTKNEVIEIFGHPPNRQSTGKGKEVWMYHFLEVQSQLSPTSYIPIINMFARVTNTQTNTQVLNVQFTGEIVSDCTYTKNESSTQGSGGMLGVQINPGQSNNATTPCDEAQ